ncbi:Mut7-C RNAse domain-containing protein [Legionella jordanis]|uniref:Twitching motility protein PilT n=1 Tax=Legionella jordanis TaxID=456 RepID=A0A0W0VCA0_9GAMM|nr:Mut7-C RNAse domain-containing protein [Legionella jordanis]KTD17738.1 hypothetical protein Ljor_2044 [Legionella jordanis]RMX01601.1 twitching motility protein PilT [Legionella jordanis]RMX21597.1 twitching motility protein PilT [Legionella jordanis]VEH11328.1 Uncharacterized conserved protein [Legionella jordanis]HAT8714510.1 twitching motility protein PilT [Legionella jordanis]
MNKVWLRFYEELNDFLTLQKRNQGFEHAVAARTAIKDLIESLGVPHAEVDLILVNGQSVNFSYQVKGGDHIAVYPVFESFDISTLTHLRAKPLRNTAFILDVHLGKLARYLRLLGFDSAYQNNFADSEIIQRSQAEKRIILTRDVGLLKHKIITHGYWLRSNKPLTQISEVLKRFDLYQACKPFSRCLECNGELKAVPKAEVIMHLQALTKKHYEQFTRCINCHRIYWQGTHYQKLKRFVEQILDEKIA